MSRRQVTHSGKDKDRDITALCNPGKDWSPRPKAAAIQDIEGEEHTYFVRTTEGDDVDVRVRSRNGRKYLTTAPDETTRNNLDDLPDC
ncbi:MAG TPA: DUF3892 domain-containing protein [Thermoanaerobaculia bacterium]|nr:DUF3892 domain-containing protein [Thermoanaerobaculia bacterium]HXT52367.1 DUF3892 domain-containing protein [Thermoanaerobaculia bacterium]